MNKLILVLILGIFLSFPITAKKKILAPGTKININTASIKVLISLPGVGKSTAMKIVDYRELKGKFKTPRDIMKVKGIGKGKYKKMKDFIIIK